MQNRYFNNPFQYQATHFLCFLSLWAKKNWNYAYDYSSFIACVYCIRK